MSRINFLDQSPEEFLRQIWGKRPHFMPDTGVDLSDITLSPDELAGMAMEDFCESRLIKFDRASTKWELLQGPFSNESDLTQLPARDWTLLVQDVDKFIPEVSALLDYVGFLPSYWLDDIMVSYAVEGGSVGAHLDRYHVFLIQAAGKREWQVEDTPREKEDYLPEVPVRLLKTFNPTSTYETKPGDVLYVPPMCAHHGIAKDNDCMTFSIGFRAPAQTQMLGSFAEYLSLARDNDKLLTDPNPQVTSHPGKLGPDHITLARKLMQDAMSDNASFEEWLGKFLSEPKFRLDVEDGSAHPTSTLVRDENCRAFYTDHDGCVLYIDGTRNLIPEPDQNLAKTLCDNRVVKAPEQIPGWLDIMIRKGYWYWA